MILELLAGCGVDANRASRLPTSLALSRTVTPFADFPSESKWVFTVTIGVAPQTRLGGVAPRSRGRLGRHTTYKGWFKEFNDCLPLTRVIVGGKGKGARRTTSCTFTRRYSSRMHDKICIIEHRRAVGDALEQHRARRRHIKRTRRRKSKRVVLFVHPRGTVRRVCARIIPLTLRIARTKRS